MDPLTLLALANGAVAAVKKGCQLYKDIKSAAGDVKGVLDDLDKQFSKQHEGKPVTREQKQQFEQKKKEIKENLSKDPNDIMSTIGDQLGTFFDAMDKIEELFYEEEKKSKEVYVGDVSLSRRALQRVLIRSRLSTHPPRRDASPAWSSSRNTDPVTDPVWPVPRSLAPVPDDLSSSPYTSGTAGRRPSCRPPAPAPCSRSLPRCRSTRRRETLLPCEWSAD